MKKVLQLELSPGTHGESTGDLFLYCSISLACHDPKHFRFTLVEGTGKSGGGVGLGGDIQ